MASQKAVSAAIGAALSVLCIALPARAQNTSIVLFTEDEQIPLTAYAEFMPAGILRITSGNIRDIPTVDSIRFIRTALTGWRPVAVMAASEELFTSEYAERRMIPIATRAVGVTALAVRVADLEDPARIAELHRAIRQPEGGDKAYFFLALASGGITRYYPFRMRTAAQ
jgi:hypothetical protein